MTVIARRNGLTLWQCRDLLGWHLEGRREAMRAGFYGPLAPIYHQRIRELIADIRALEWSEALRTGRVPT